MKFTKRLLQTKSCNSSWMAFSTEGEVKRFSQNVLCCWLFSNSQEEEKKRERQDFLFFYTLDKFRCTQLGDKGRSIFIITDVHWNSHQTVRHLHASFGHSIQTPSPHSITSPSPLLHTLLVSRHVCCWQWVGFPPSLSLIQHPLPMQHQWLSLLSSILHLTHTNKPTHIQTTHSTHAKHMPTVTLLSHTHKYMQTQLKPTHSHWPLSPFRSL